MNQKKSSVTINDLAKASGVSPSTISRALSNSPKISERTKQKVRDVALKLGYISSIQAAIQQNFNNNTIGIIVPTLIQTKYSILVESARSILEEKGFIVIISCSSQSIDQEQKILQLFDLLNVQGIIGTLAGKDDNSTFLSNINKNIPVVLFDHVNFELPYSKVIIDHFQVGFKAARHLLEIGCRRIAHLGGDINSLCSKQISTGFRTAIRNSGLSVNSKTELFSDFLYDDLSKAVEILFNQNETPDAIIVDDLFTAHKLISILRTTKIRVPEDVSVIAISSEMDNSHFTHSITTIQLPYSKIGITAATRLVEQLQTIEKERQHEIIVEPFQIIIRNSTLRS